MRYHLCFDEDNYYLGSFDAEGDGTAAQYAVDWLISEGYIDPEKDYYEMSSLESGGMKIIVKDFNLPETFAISMDVFTVVRDKEI